MECKITSYHYQGVAASVRLMWREEINAGGKANPQLVRQAGDGVVIDRDGQVDARGLFSLEEATRRASALAGEYVKLTFINMECKGTFGAPVDLPALLARNPKTVRRITETAIVVFFFPGNARIEATGEFQFTVLNDRDMRETLSRMAGMVAGV